MTSIHTSQTAMISLTLLRQNSAASMRMHNQAATGLRVAEAADNAAYWSISTTMRSSAASMSVIQDGLGLAAARLDVTYSALDETRATLEKIKSRLLTAASDPSKAQAVQTEIDKLIEHTRQIAQSANFGGENWLATNVTDIYEAELPDRSAQILTSISKAASGTLATSSIDFDLKRVSLFNETGGGMLQPDPRSPGTIGGIRNTFSVGATSSANMRSGSDGHQSFTFAGPVDLSGGKELTFTLTVDADHPDVPGPHHPGQSHSITIDQATVEAVEPGSGGIIADYQAMAEVLSHALSRTGAAATLYWHWNEGRRENVPDRFGIYSRETSGLDGSSVAISNLSEELGGLTEFTAHGSRGNEIRLSFDLFKLYKDVEVDFTFWINNSSQSGKLDRATIDSLLGKEDGRVETAAEMVQLLEHMVGQPGLVIEEDAGSIVMRTDASDRLAGNKSEVGFTGISVNIEPLPGGLESIDVAANPYWAEAYLRSVESMLSRVTDAAAYVGATRNRVSLQSDFLSRMQDSLARGISQLVDADMNEVAVRTRALQVQRELVTQSLSIANASTEIVLQLFNGPRQY